MHQYWQKKNDVKSSCVFQTRGCICTCCHWERNVHVLQEKKLEKWAANVSAEFEEIDSFELCVE